MTDYRPISDYAAIGNLQTVALIGRDGTLDWLCLPHFDSPSVFAGLLDAKVGGRFSIAPSIPFTTEQFYEPFTNVLVTRFITASGGAELVDLMPPYTNAPARRAPYHPELHRGLRGVWGEVPFRVVCDPQPNYAQSQPVLELTPAGCLFRSPGVRLALSSDLQLGRDEHGMVAEGSISHGIERWIVLRHCGHPGCTADLFAAGVAGSSDKYRQTLKFWRAWADRCRYHGRWRQEVIRSALLIKLLTFGPTGALVAAPTTSLPEMLGGSLNWDYRYCWLRDAAMALKALLRLGYVEETQAFFGWLEARSLEPDGLQALYGIDGRRELTEQTLPHLEGYRGSGPVRVGNAAYTQLQLDVYGEVLSAFSHLTRRRRRLPRRIWVALRRAVDTLCERWDKPDAGIWEVRGPGRHFVHSKLMAWAALDRALGLLDPLGQGVGLVTSLTDSLQGLFGRRRPVSARWTEVKEAVARDVLTRGWRAGRGAFTQHYEGDDLDASLLLLPTCRFLPSEDERVHATLELIEKELVVDGLVYRYRGPGALQEGAFVPCSFWLVDALAAVGRTSEARAAFEMTLARASHLGLYSEEIDPATGSFLGNFPQALSHLGLIDSALTLDPGSGA